jgi:hypothetical protein
MPGSLTAGRRNVPHDRAVVIFLIAIAVSGLRAKAEPGQTTNRRSPERYESAALDANGNLAIRTSAGRSITVRKTRDQTSFESVTVARSRDAVAAEAMFKNCCTSYDIPLQLVIYADGQVHRFKGIGLPIFEWRLSDDGTQVAYGQEPVHFGCVTHYELRDIRTERLLDSFDVEQPCSQIPEPKAVTLPQWVVDLRTRTK